ncbi:MAG TPA: non-canonical purine NTP pyrophosphatase [Tenericutes bacterium]|nr:non-canonical purine NTP pyrophosphatase [Mycoplasmatota bacterium]
MKLIYVTGNKYKIYAAKKFLEPLGIEIEAKKIDCPEIQADTEEEVAKFSSKYASDYLKTSVLKSDSALIIPALKNFPSVYAKYVEETIGEDGILKLMEGIDDRRAYFTEALAYTEYGKEPIVFMSITEGEIAKEKQGEYGWGYDKIFIPKGATKTLACFNDDERWQYWDDSGYIELAKYLKR